MNIRTVILAAGKGKRMGSTDRPKVLHLLREKPMLSYVLEAVIQSGVDAKPMIVVGYMAEQVKAVCGDACEYVLQEELKGTGDAVARTRPFLEGTADHVMVLNGDQPFVSASTLRKIVDVQIASGATLTLGTSHIEDFEEWRKPFADFGRIVRDSRGKVASIVEAKDSDPTQLALREVNPSLYCFKAEWLWKSLETLTNKNAQGEYYITDLLASAIDSGELVMTVPVPPEEALGINTIDQLGIAEAMMNGKK
jgi:bifunctional N-acetylglucosamine-1-phosphate-uridyltransferase/glucosamine-1-phosphate-acetyltransferase GlmU-like protein